jgi:deoxycytidine triphosphate deaminase
MNSSSFSGVLSDQQILDEMTRDNIFIHPYQEKNLSNSSYDVCLGPYYYRAKKENGLFLPWDEESVREYWGECQYANTILDEVDARRFKLAIGTQYILLEPGELILGHTLEYIGGKNHICSMMKCRSSLGRVGISVCKDAAFGNIGYVNRWTMEISNFSSATVPLVVGSRVAQILFFYSGQVRKSYENGGSYQNNYKTTDELIKNWCYTDMLPKLNL